MSRLLSRLPVWRVMLVADPEVRWLLPAVRLRPVWRRAGHVRATPAVRSVGVAGLGDSRFTVAMEARTQIELVSHTDAAASHRSRAPGSEKRLGQLFERFITSVRRQSRHRGQAHRRLDAGRIVGRGTRSSAAGDRATGLRVAGRVRIAGTPLLQAVRSGDRPPPRPSALLWRWIRRNRAPPGVSRLPAPAADLAARYEQEKRRCPRLSPHRPDAYTDCKSRWIKTVEAEALRCRGSSPP